MLEMVSVANVRHWVSVPPDLRVDWTNSAPEVPASLASGTTRSVIGRATQKEAIKAIKAIMKTR